MYRFEWDEAKAKENLRNHGVSFREGSLAFNDPHAVTGEDETHSKDERRQWLIGQSPKQRILLVVFTERWKDIFRIISVWKATDEECELYENEKD